MHRRAPCRKCKVVRYRSHIYKSSISGAFVKKKEYEADTMSTYRQTVLVTRVLKCNKHGGKR